MKLEMTNEELSDAIDQMYTIICVETLESSVYGDANNHFKELLEIQRLRAEITTADIQNIRKQAFNCPLNKITITALDILRDTADDLDLEGDIDTTTTRLVIRAAVSSIEGEIKRLREALTKIVCEPINAEYIAQQALDA